MITSIVIATYNKLDYTRLCIESIREYTQRGTYEIIVVDNHSTDGSRAWLANQPDIKLIANEENLGFPKACNQGIEFSQGDNILLLNNDTIVTRNWLENLVTALYSDPRIGAVGSVTNYCSYYQTIAVHYEGLEDMHRFAEDHNRSNPRLWEERLKLIGYCMLIRKSVIDQVGLLDERFTPGNFEDDDYSLRIRKSGFRLLLCKDTFIHHFGSTSFKDNANAFSNLLRTNQQKYMEKWGFDPETANTIRTELIGWIERPREAALRVLEIGCGCGGTLLKIKDLYPQAELYGIEANRAALETASLFVQTVDANSEGILNHYEECFFDFILLGDNLHLLDLPKQTLAKLRDYLKGDGQIIASVPNLLHYDVVRGLMDGTVTRPQLGYLKLSEVEDLFRGAGYESLEIQGITSNIGPDDEKFIQSLATLNRAGVSEPYKIHKLLVRAGKVGVEARIFSLLERLAQEESMEELYSELSPFEDAQILEAIEKQPEHQVEWLNRVAILFFQHKERNRALPFLNKAFELDPEEVDTLFNLGYILHAMGESEVALGWLEQIPNKDDSIAELIREISEPLVDRNTKDTHLKFMLRRVEQDVDKENSLVQLIGDLSEGRTSIDEIARIAERDLIDKDETLNQLAVECYRNERYDLAMGLFQQSHRFNPVNQDTLYNLGYMLYDLEEFEHALSLLESIQQKDEETISTIMRIREELGQ